MAQPQFCKHSLFQLTDSHETAGAGVFGYMAAGAFQIMPLLGFAGTQGVAAIHALDLPREDANLTSSEGLGFTHSPGYVNPKTQ